MTPKLYSFKESGNCYKISLFAAMVQVEVDIVEIDFLNNEHKSENYLAINARGTVPTLVDNQHTFTESAAILIYLAGKSEQSRKSWWSDEAVEQAAIVDWLVFASERLGPGLATARGIKAFPELKRNQTPEKLAVALESSTDLAKKSLETFEKHLKNKEWLVLGRPTIADIANFVYPALAPMGGISLDDYPAVQAWIQRIRGLPRAFPLVGMDDPNYRRK